MVATAKLAVVRTCTVPHEALSSYAWLKICLLFLVLLSPTSEPQPQTIQSTWGPYMISLGGQGLRQAAREKARMIISRLQHVKTTVSQDCHNMVHIIVCVDILFKYQGPSIKL